MSSRRWVSNVCFSSSPCDPRSPVLHRQCRVALEASHIECVDVSDGNCNGAKLELIVVSDKFDKVPLLKRHRMVNECLSDLLASNAIHAMTMKTWTPTQYESKK